MKEVLNSLLPESAYNKLKHFYKEHITEYKRDIYSEFGEDFIAAVLLGFKKEGTYVDVGAFRPKELSVTYYFYKKLGWQGVIVEPNPVAAGEFAKERPKDIFVQNGVAGESGELTYYEFEDATLNSFSEEAFNNFEGQFVKKQNIAVRPLKEILDEKIKEGQHIDLMNVDVEGLDLEVLNSNDWDKYSPTVLIVEDLHFNPEDPLKSEVVQLLKSKGYSLKANCFISLVFMKD